tara:strand:+ start:567 stop:758 length:192 start_codon:yes stop_codon:yes gene_type:complete
MIKNTQPGDQQLLLKDYEVAKKLNCSKSNVHRWTASGDIPSPIKIGSNCRWILKEIKWHCDQS